MAARRLKVFRTAIGFHDAYVAAPSQKAAIAAWGASADLFARGEAEVVTDPDLTAAPLAAPGTIVKRLRGTADEQIAALPPDKPRAAAKPERNAPRASVARSKPETPRPTRDALDAAEKALAAAAGTHAAERRSFAAREKALVRERKAAEQAFAKEEARLEQVRDDAAAAYASAMRRWRN